MRKISIAALMLCLSSPVCLAQINPCPPPTLSVDGGTSASSACAPASLLAEKYPGDVGIASDPDVIWHENFEAASVSAVTSRYHTASNAAGMSFDSSVPSNSRGAKSLRFYSASGGASNDQTTDLYRNFGTGYDEMYVRYYVRYQPNVQWHHSGMWIGGYNPGTNWPNPRASTRPVGDERFSVGFEPKGGQNAANVQLDFYNYWMNMRSWQVPPPAGNSGFFGNNVLHDTRATAPGNAWVCVELHVKMNEPSSTAGGELGVWVNDTSLQQFTSQAPLGYWVRDKFCPNNTTDRACTDFKPANPTLVPLDVRWRTTSALKANHIWMNNYLSGGPAGAMWMDDVVVAKKRIGCLR